MTEFVSAPTRGADPATPAGGCAISLAGVSMVALASGMLWIPDTRTLVVADLHLGKAERNARRTGGLWPPHENTDTLTRLEEEVRARNAETLILLGDSFDDDRCVDQLGVDDMRRIERLAEAVSLIWITGNHDPGQSSLPGTCCDEFSLGSLIFRHIADPTATAEISGHYHPKAVIRAKSRTITRRCFLLDNNRMILPAFGTYTGGLEVADPAFSPLLNADADVILTGSPTLKTSLAKLRAGSKQR